MNIEAIADVGLVQTVAHWLEKICSASVEKILDCQLSHHPNFV